MYLLHTADIIRNISKAKQTLDLEDVFPIKILMSYDIMLFFFLFLLQYKET
jgi:hypothetical protein